LTHEVLPRALVAFRRRHPRVTIHGEGLHTPQIVPALPLREAAVGLALTPVPPPGLAHETPATSPSVRIAPRGRPARAAAAQGAVDLAALDGVRVVALDAREPVGTSRSQACRDAGVSLNAVITVQTYHAALAMAHHGLGVALVYACTSRSADRSRV